MWFSCFTQTSQPVRLASRGQAYYDSGLETFVWAPVVQQPRTLFGRSAVFTTPIFDSEEIGTTWDRVFVDACLPSGTAIDKRRRRDTSPAGAGTGAVNSPEDFHAHHSTALREYHGLVSPRRGEMFLNRLIRWRATRDGATATHMVDALPEEQ